MGKTPSRNTVEYWDSPDQKWISISDLSKSDKYISEIKECISDKAVEESSISLIHENTVIMSFKLSIGKVAITSEPMYSNEAIMSFRNKGVVELLPDYVYYLLLGQDWEHGTNNAVMGKTLNKATISKVKIRIHPLEAQHSIVSTLDKLQSIIAHRKQQLAKLDELVKARFVEMFGMLGTDINGWGLQSLGKCCKINPKKTDDKRLNSSLEVSFIPMSAVSENGNIDISETKNYDDVKTGFTYFAENDVIFAKITPCMENGKGAVTKGLCNGI